MQLDDLMPRYDVAARYETLIKASPARTFAVLQYVDFSQSGIIRFLMGLRTLGRRAGKPAPKQSLTQRMRQAGFMEVAPVENQHLVIGIVGRFLRPYSGVLRSLSAEEILAFQTEGY